MTTLTQSSNFLYTVTLLLLLFLLIVVVYPAIFLELEEEPEWTIWTLLSIAIACWVEYYTIPLAIRRLGEDLEVKMREWRLEITGVIEELGRELSEEVKRRQRGRRRQHIPGSFPSDFQKGGTRNGLHYSDAKREEPAEEIRVQENEEVVIIGEELLDTQFPLLGEANYNSTHENKVEELTESKTEPANSATKIPHFSEERLTSPPTPTATPVISPKTSHKSRDAHLTSLEPKIKWRFGGKKIILAPIPDASRRNHRQNPPAELLQRAFLTPPLTPDLSPSPSEHYRSDKPNYTPPALSQHIPNVSRLEERGKQRLKNLLEERRKKVHWDLPENEMKSKVFEYEEPPVILNWRDPAEAHRMIDWAEKMLAGIREKLQRQKGVHDIRGLINLVVDVWERWLRSVRVILRDA
ncbi:hypothetical protein RUND412_001581 [Rhizina undulata]